MIITSYYLIMLWLLATFVVVFLVIRRWKLARFIQLSQKLYCGIKSYPIVGHAYLFTGNGTQAFQVLGREAIHRDGITSVWMGDKLYVVVVDAADIETILKTSLQKDDVMRFVKNIVGNSLVSAPVSIWKSRRKIVAPAFSPKKLNNFTSSFNQQSRILLEQIKATADENVVSIWNYMNAFKWDSICENTFGVKCNAQKNQEKPLLNALNKCNKLLADRMTRPWLYPNIVYNMLPYYHQFTQNKKMLYNFINKVITSTRESLKENNCNTVKSSQNSFLHYLLQSNRYTNSQLQEETLMLIIAGSDSSALAESYVISMMAKYPDVQDKVFQELQNVLGNENKDITAADLLHLKYLEAVIKETLRLYPPIPVVTRLIEEDLILPSGVKLLKGCGVFVNIWGTHRNPKYWGDDAEHFRPERFLEAPLEHPFAFLPFSQGPRNCLGYQYAMKSMKIVVATLLQSYQVLSDVNKAKNYDEPINVAFDDTLTRLLD